MADKIIVLNLGTTSFKCKLFDFARGEHAIASCAVERIGAASPSPWQFKAGDTRQDGQDACHDHAAAFQLCMGLLQDHGLIQSLDDLDGAGFKTVHGGSINGAVPVDDAVLAILDDYAAFAPAHNPMYAALMRQLRTKHPGLRQVACFETAFHADMPAYRAAYGVPYAWMAMYGVRRYGFHGASHSYIAAKMRDLAPDARRVISLHLGGSSSLCAIKDGKSIATSMGATPQSGLFQNNRVGDFDLFCLPRLVAGEGSLDRVINTLASASGFLGLSGVSNDLRDVLQAADAGNKQAALAFAAFADNCIGYIGMFTAYLQGLDAVVFTGGIGLNCAPLREKICRHFDYLGVAIDTKLTTGKISTPSSKITVWCLETNEELMVARQTRDVLSK
ncbi:MAG: acetate/propionate family kinase [Lentisphaeria bacterium]|nr:acetate/propionate family kinase [Lentisphaeria bacterium]